MSALCKNPPEYIHFDIIVRYVGVKKSSSVCTPGETREPQESQYFKLAPATQYRATSRSPWRSLVGEWPNRVNQTGHCLTG